MSTTHPFKWARDKSHKAERYARDRYVGVMTTARDVSLPGVPLAALIGVACNGSDDENTTGWIVGDNDERARAVRSGEKPLGGDPEAGYGKVLGNDLDELGRFGVEAGHRPTPVATDPSCAWVELARGEVVKKILGRPGVEGARWHKSVEDQIAIGVADIARHARSVRKKLDARLRWDEDGDDGPKTWTLWPFFCGVSGWSAGDGGISRHLVRFADELAALPPNHRVGAFLKLAGSSDDPGGRHRQDEYTALRWAQKREAMWLASGFTGEREIATAWLDDGISSERQSVYDDLVRLSA